MCLINIRFSLTKSLVVADIIDDQYIDLFCCTKNLLQQEDCVSINNLLPISTLIHILMANECITE